MTLPMDKNGVELQIRDFVKYRDRETEHEIETEGWEPTDPPYWYDGVVVDFDYDQRGHASILAIGEFTGAWCDAENIEFASRDNHPSYEPMVDRLGRKLKIGDKVMVGTVPIPDEGIVWVDSVIHAFVPLGMLYAALVISSKSDHRHTSGQHYTEFVSRGA